MPTADNHLKVIRCAEPEVRSAAPAVISAQPLCVMKRASEDAVFRSEGRHAGVTSLHRLRQSTSDTLERFGMMHGDLFHARLSAR